MRTALIVTVAFACVLSLATGASAATPIASTACGSGRQATVHGKPVYLQSFFRRRGVTCAGAKAVFAAAQRVRHGYACGRQVHHSNGWTIRHVGPAGALSSRYTKGAKSFDVAEQGGC